MDRSLTLLIVGGYGTFGGRLAHLLAGERRLTLLIGGRSLRRAQEFCSREGSARWRPVHFDRDAGLDGQLRALAPDMVVDASGPFQSYGDRPYRLVEACIDCGIHYLDLADSAAFVCGIGRFDERARERGVFVLSGVSSFPVLTAAVVRLLSADMARVESIVGGIAPSPFANVGLNVIRAIAGYAGKAVRLRDAGAGSAGGGERVGYALTETVRYTIAAPGVLPLHSNRFSLVDVPDLQVLAQLWPECGVVWMGAGPVPGVWHRLLRGLAWLVRFRMLPSLSFLAPLMYRAINTLSWGEHRGGMFVRVAGVDAHGAHVARSWHLVAEGEDGPFIPSMAAEAIVRKCLDGAAPGVGARAAVRELEVADYEPLLSRREIRVGVREDDSGVGALPLYQRVLGSAWDSLPETLRAMHAPGAVGTTKGSEATDSGARDNGNIAFTQSAIVRPANLAGAAFALEGDSVRSLNTSLIAAGRAEVTRGTGWLASLVASFVGFPLPGSDVPVEVRFDVAGDRETWSRRFAGRSFASEQFPGTGVFDRLVCERFGPVTLALALVVSHVGGRVHLRLIVRGWSLFGVRLPRALAPQYDAQEFERDGCFHFDVAIRHRWVGLIVHYRGWLVPQTL